MLLEQLRAAASRRRDRRRHVRRSPEPRHHQRATACRSGSTCRSTRSSRACPADGRRPLAADRAEFERLYPVRRAAYEHAHLRLDAGRASVDALVEQMIDWLEH